MKTASFFKYFGPGRISIARRFPKAMAARGESKICVYKGLAPPPWLLKESKEKEYSLEQFEILYRQVVLDRLDRGIVHTELTNLVNPPTAQVFIEPVLLCWEHEPADCHRSIVAKWFAEGGIEVLESKIEKRPERPHP